MTTTNEIKNLKSHQLVAENLLRLLDLATKVEESRSKLYLLYVEWSDTTNNTAESILKIREEIIKHNLNSNIAALTGTSTAIVGSALSIIGIVFAFPTAGLSLGLTVGGAVTATLGGAVATGSQITKNALSRQQCEEAKEVFLRNTTLTESLEEQRELYFDLVDQFKNEMEAFSAEDVQTVFVHISEHADIFSKDFELDEDLRNSLPPKSKYMDEIKPQDVEQKDILIYFSKLLTLVKEDPLLKRLFANSELWKVVNLAMKQLMPNTDLGKIFSKGSILLGPADGGILAGGTIIKSAETLQNIFQGMSMTFRVGMGILNSVFLVWGIVDLVMTSIDVHNGSTSNETEELLRVADELKKYREEVIEIMATTFEWHI